jgi:hypothetical protein
MLDLKGTNDRPATKPKNIDLFDGSESRVVIVKG